MVENLKSVQSLSSRRDRALAAPTPHAGGTAKVGTTRPTGEGLAAMRASLTSAIRTRENICGRCSASENVK